MAYDFDLLTIGGGSGGVAGSRRAASYGARVGVIEGVRLGGTCVLRGCVPKKLLIYGVDFADAEHDARGFGWTTGQSTLDWGKLIAAKNAELDRLNGIYINLCTSVGVKLIDGWARLEDAHTVVVAKDGRETRYTADKIMLATGGAAVMPDIPGKELMINSDQALDLKTLPKRIAILGAGYIAVEFAGIFHAAGVEVDLFIRGDQVLRGFDEETRQHLAACLTARGIRLHFGAQSAKVEAVGDSRRLHLADGRVIDADIVMAATGRLPNTKGIGLEQVGVATGENGVILTDEWSRTSVPNIYAVGDATSRVNLTPVAIAEARAVAETLYNDNPMQIGFDLVPTAVFSRPEVATVGMTEEVARQVYDKVDVYSTRFRPMRETLAGGTERTFMKLVVDADSDKVLGCHMVGPDAAEIVQGLAVALQAGATKADFNRTIGIHPTAAEEFVTMRDKRSTPFVTAAKAAE